MTMPPLKRVALALLGCLPVGLLATAAFLQLSPSGIGTHTQLGMPECGIVRMFGMRCPTCGMTTAWAHAVRGQFGQAATANVTGLLLAVLAPLAACWLLVSAICGRWCPLRPQANLVLGLAAAVMTVGLVDWLVRVWPQW